MTNFKIKYDKLSYGMQRRVLLGYSPTQISKHAGISGKTILSIERGKSTTTANLKKYVDTLDRIENERRAEGKTVYVIKEN